MTYARRVKAAPERHARNRARAAGGAVQNLGKLAVLAVPPLAHYPVNLPLIQR